MTEKEIIGIVIILLFIVLIKCHYENSSASINYMIFERYKKYPQCATVYNPEKCVRFLERAEGRYSLPQYREIRERSND